MKTYSTRTALYAAATLCALLSSPSQCAKTQRWNVYKNERYAFCVEYPKEWSLNESFTQNGASLTPPEVSAFRLPPRIVVGARVNQPSENDAARSRTLREDSEFGINSLIEYGGAGEVRILERQSTKVQGYPALVTSLRYKKGAANEVWRSLNLTILTQDSTIFFIELKCHPDDYSKLRTVFEHLRKSFKFICPK